MGARGGLIVELIEPVGRRGRVLPASVAKRRLARSPSITWRCWSRSATMPGTPSQRAARRARRCEFEYTIVIPDRARLAYVDTTSAARPLHRALPAPARGHGVLWRPDRRERLGRALRGRRTRRRRPAPRGRRARRGSRRSRADRRAGFASPAAPASSSSASSGSPAPPRSCRGRGAGESAPRSSPAIRARSSSSSSTPSARATKRSSSPGPPSGSSMWTTRLSSTSSSPSTTE